MLIRSLAVVTLAGLLSFGRPDIAEAQVSPDSIVLRAGDAVRVTVWKRPELTGEFLIAHDGTIAHPVFLTVVAAQRPFSSVVTSIRRVLETFETQPQFVAEPLVRVAVSGHVRTPSLYQLPPSMTISQAIALAGGGLEQARLDQIRVYRNSQVLLVNLTAPDGALAQLRVQSGDQIYVDRRRSVFREYIAPVASVTAAVAAIANVILRSRE